MAREHERFDSSRPIECRVNGQCFTAPLRNVSLSGCMVETPLNRVCYRDRLFAKVEGSIHFSGMVVWIEENLAGMRFDEQIHEAVVRFLGYEPVEAIPSIPLDRLGRSLPRLPRTKPVWARA
jgi:hypothetical protein